MKFEVRSEILGFKNIKEVELKEVDELFSTLRCQVGEDISFTLVDPAQLREYSFEVSQRIEELLDIKDEKDLLVYNILVLQSPLDESRINFQAPLIFNKANMTVAQEILGLQAYPKFGLDESLKTYTSGVR
ncbi:flagellar assembly protein FliW [Sulfurimonas sp. MAG313]|nr:flagellar assembly protein FliW [Sulfurimonas sp. MAG313]MDF1881894.1 flagellar assembly protein FliW [Sulfurimonas sp. MAG313]